jgi:hypothetical protein
MEMLMQLPQDWEDRFREDLAEYEDEQKMPYVTSIERIGIRKGHELGLREGLEQGRELAGPA